VFDLTDPSITIVSPLLVLYPLLDQTVEYTIIDPSGSVPSVGLNSTSARLFQNGTEIWNNFDDSWNGTGNLLILWPFINAGTGNTSVELVLTIKDNAGHLATSQTITITFDRTPPTILSVTPVDQTYYYTDQFRVDMSTSDGETTINTTSAYVDIGGSIYPLTYDSGTVVYLFHADTLTFADLDLDQTIIFGVSDSAGNLITQTIVYQADLINPTIQFNVTESSENNAYLLNTITIAFTASDSQTGINPSNYQVYRNGILNATFIPTVSQFDNGNSGTFTFTDNIPSGITSDITYSIQVEDMKGNSIQSSNFVILADTIAPTVTFNESLSITNDTYYLGAITITFNVSDDETGISNLVYVVKNGSVDTDLLPILAFDNLSFSFTDTIPVGITSDQTYVLRVYDNNNQTSDSTTIIVRADTIAPTVTYSASLSNNIHYSYAIGAISIVFDVSDDETGINGTNVDVVKNGLVDPVPSTSYDDTADTITITDTILGGITADQTYILRVNDNNQQTADSTEVVILADDIAPSFSIVSPSNGSIQNYDLVTLLFDIWDNETDIDTSSVQAYSVTGPTQSLLLSQISQTGSGNGSVYRFQVNISRNNLILTQEIQNVKINFTDSNQISAQKYFRFSTDVDAPSIISGSSTILDELDEEIDLSTTNVSLGVHYITFDVRDLPSSQVSTGVNYNSIQLTRTINGLSTTFNFNYADENLTITRLGSTIIIFWNTTLENLGAERGDENYRITWTLQNMEDNIGNSLSSSEIENYFIIIPSPPPPFNWAGFIVTGLVSSGVFLGVGMGAAVIYERLRYE
jgi:hypothetical protein